VINNIIKTLYLSVLTGLLACQPSPAPVGDEQARAAGSSRLSELLRDDDTAFPKVLTAREFDFPADHGAHEEFRNEWWYFTGNIDGPDGRRFGYELTIFRFALTPTVAIEADSDWQTNQVYIGHFALTDVSGERFHVAQRYSRGAAGLAGSRSRPFAVWLEDWRIDGSETGFPWRLTATDGEMSIDLELVPQKPVVLNGDRGLSQKSSEPGNASYYYSIPRLETSGVVAIDGTSVEVTGLSWLDREWGSSALSSGQEGWDWFALQLSDGTDLMFYTLRQSGGGTDRHSAGTWIAAEGNAEHLGVDDVTIEVTRHWDSSRGGRYPGGWRIAVPDKALTIDVQPVVLDQELVTNVRYWEGAVDVSGERNGQPIKGRGYVELTGYADE
jgi:predicted secreted hydrolase